MSTAVELAKPHEHPAEFTKPAHDEHKASMGAEGQQQAAPNSPESKSQQHPLLHQYDHSQMGKFYEACVGKLAEQMPKWSPSEWSKATPMPAHGLSLDEQKRWPNPVVIGEKQRVYECFATLAKDLGEPMILMPNFDISDLQNFELFLDSLKSDGVNAIRKYKQYLSNKDMRKQEIDLVAVHARYGVILVEVKDSDYVDYKRRSRAKAMVGQTKSLFKALGRLIAESKGLPAGAESAVPVMEFVALPNVQERPQQPAPKPQAQPAPQPASGEQAPAPRPEAGPSAPASSSRQLNYLVKADMESSAEFMKWWSKSVVEPKLEQERWSEEAKKPSRFDVGMLNALVALVNCIRANAILPVVYPENGGEVAAVPAKEEGPAPQQPEQQQQQPQQPGEEKPRAEDKDEKEAAEQLSFQPALNIHAEFFRPRHEAARSLAKCLVLSQDPERIRRTICLQTLWLLLNDAQKKISVVCSELNKPYYEEFFARQRKIYANYLNNVRFYTDVQSCEAGEGATRTLKKDGEVWIFDAHVAASLPEMLERVKTLNSFWVFGTSGEEARSAAVTDKLAELAARLVDLDEDKEEPAPASIGGPSATSIKLPLRLQCDLLIIGDMIGANQLKYLHKYLQTKAVPSQAGYYQQNAGGGPNHHGAHHGHQQQQPHMQHLNFNPMKKFRTVKFIRGGSIDNIRNALKMHDSIQAQCVVMHVGDEDLFKTRYSVSTIERIKELATLVKEYCPKSFVVMSTLMRRQSRTENAATSEVNKGIVQFCKQTRDSLNCFYMQNQHFEPEYHTQGGRLLNNKGLKSYVDNILFVVDYFLIKNNKQH